MRLPLGLPPSGRAVIVPTLMGPTPPAIDTILRAMGRTPLVRLERLEQPGGPRLFAKCEYLGPGNSIFDRAAVMEIVAAKQGGHLTPDRGLVTAGGSDAVISLAMAASATGHPLTIVVPRSLNVERRRALTDYGAKLVTVEDELGLHGALERAFELVKERDDLYMDLLVGQEIVDAYATIGTELIEALGHVPTLTVCGLDLGAIPTGIAKALGGGRLVAVEPATARISKGEFGPHLLGGLAPAADPIALDRERVRDFEAVSDREAWDMAERLSRETGLLAGIASGAVMVAALRRAADLTGGEVVAVLPDSGERRFMLAGFFP
jgi:cysteine synthase